jgi:GDP-L-fucose synthase
LASACLFLMQGYSGEELVNVGWGQDLSIAELATLVSAAVGFKGEFEFDASKPDGTPRKLLDVRKLTALGWTPAIGLCEGLSATYKWFEENVSRLRD